MNLSNESTDRLTRAGQGAMDRCPLSGMQFSLWHIVGDGKAV